MLNNWVWARSIIASMRLSTMAATSEVDTAMLMHSFMVGSVARPWLGGARPFQTSFPAPPTLGIYIACSLSIGMALVEFALISNLHLNPAANLRQPDLVL